MVSRCIVISPAYRVMLQDVDKEVLRCCVRSRYEGPMGPILKNIKQTVRRYPVVYSIVKKLSGIERKQRLQREKEWQHIHASPELAAIPVLDFNETKKASFENVRSQAATYDQMNSAEYKKWCVRLREEPNFHRKSWEYTYILKALEQSGKLFKRSRGLGFGVGKEPMVAYMVKQKCEIVATDMDPQMAKQIGWAQTGEYSEKLVDLNPRLVCTDRQLRKHVDLRVVDMNHIPEDLLSGEFDFVWSACAFEHLGSIDLGVQFVLNSIKALKPGGVAVHTTEFNISSNDRTIETGGTVLFRRKDIERIAELANAEGCEVNLNFDLGSQRLDKHYDVAPFSDFHHLRLQLDQYVTTSYGLLITKVR